MSDSKTEWDFALCVIFAIVGVIALAFLVGITTHRSHLADLRYAHQEMQTCIQSDRPASDCRLIVYGSK